MLPLARIKKIVKRSMEETTNGGSVFASMGPHMVPLARIKKIVKCSVGETVDGDDKTISGEVLMVFSKAITEFTCCLGGHVVWTMHNTGLFDFLIHLIIADNVGLAGATMAASWAS